MARDVKFTPRAGRDVNSAVRWYESQRSGLGVEFEQAVDTSLELVRQMPEAAPVVVRDLRRLLLARFPYAVYYRLTERTIEVRACLHTRSDPKRLRSRA